MSNVVDLNSKYEFDVYPKRDVVLVKGKDAKVWDENGREYIDCVGGIGVASVGHANEKVATAVAEQAKTLISCPGIFYNDKKSKFLEKLITVTPASLTKAFITNSGTEAVEAALKFARFTTGKTDFITAMKGFHGRTFGAMSATYKKVYREPYEPLVPGFSYVPFNNFEKMESAVTEKTAAVILEIIQGEGGINIGNEEYFAKVRKLCDDKGILLIIDEIQTGFCRTGKMFASDHFNLQPDIMTVAKAVGGGMPLGAALCSDKILIPKGKHGTTFGGNPLACAAGIAAIDYMLENGLAAQAEYKGAYFMEKLAKIDSGKIRGIRGKGLMIGIELKEKVQPYLLGLLEKGVLALPAGTTVIRLLPPIVISEEEIDFVADKIREILI